ncbi:MAG: PorP/SprF family type IX secretion system membrane protein [Salibacteraceae bacterium]
MKKLVIIWLFFVGLSQVHGQDVHFSQFLYSPFTINPALTGNFDGRYRFGFNYKQQWRSISAPFRTTALWADSRQFLNLEKTNAGIHFYYDMAGTSEYNTLSFSIPLSFQVFTSGNKKHSINLGVQPSFISQSINRDKLTSDAQWNGNKFDPNAPINEDISFESANSIDLALGVSYRLTKNKWDVTTGFSVYNLITPKTPFAGPAQKSEIPFRYNAHLGAKIDLNEKWFLTPGIIYSRQAKFHEIVFGTEFNYVLNNNPYRYRVIFLGFWDRGVDAGITNIGMYYNNWRVGMGYDVNYSPLKTASDYRGGWELSVIYILRDVLPKRTNFKNCPNYI